MVIGVQDVVAGAVALAAFGWLIRRRLKRGAAGPACEGCPAATSAPGASEKDFVPLGDLVPPAPKAPRARR